jgi:serine/threonine protein kinase
VQWQEITQAPFGFEQHGTHNGVPVSVKRIPYPRRNLQLQKSVMKEIKIMATLSHLPTVVTLHGEGSQVHECISFKLIGLSKVSKLCITPYHGVLLDFDAQQCISSIAGKVMC